MKISSLVGLAFAVLSNAYADDRLFPTDILTKGEVDMRLSIGHDSHSEDIHSNGASGRSSSSQTLGDVQFRYGLGADWHVGMALAHATHAVVNADYRNPPEHYSNRSGKGERNPVFWASYGIVNDKVSPFSLSAQVLVSPDTTGDAKTSYSGRVNAGFKSDDTLKYFGQLSIGLRDELGFDGYGINVGAYKRLSEALTLVPHAFFSRHKNAVARESWSQYGIGMSAHVKLGENSYLVPDVAFSVRSVRTSNDQLSYSDESRNGKKISLGFYHLF